MRKLLLLLCIGAIVTYLNPSTTADPRTRGSVRRASGFVQSAMELIDRSSLQSTDLINKQNQRGRTPCNRASQNSSGHGRIYGNQHVSFKRAVELGEGLLRNRCVKVLRIDERGR